MSEFSPWRQGLVAVGAAAALALTTTACEAAPRQDISIQALLPEEEAKSRNMVDPTRLPLGAATLLHVYPIAVEAEGFRAPNLPASTMQYMYGQGWRDLERARGRQADVHVEVEPVRAVTLPGVTETPDLCDAKQRLDFRGALLKAVQSGEASPKPSEGKSPEENTSTYKKTVPIVVIEQTGAPHCVLADASKGGTVVVYDGTSASVQTAAHELGHEEGAGHDATLEACPSRTTAQANTFIHVGALCRVDEYGSVFTVMGHGDAPLGLNEEGPDADIYSGFGELRIDGLDYSKVYQVDPDFPDEQVVTLSSLEDATGGPQLIRIPLAPGAKGQEPVIGLATKDNGKKEVPVYASAAYVELSGSTIRLDDQRHSSQPVSVKVYLVDESQDLANTYMLPLGQGNDTPNYEIDATKVGQLFTFQVGSTCFSLHVDLLESRGNAFGSAQVGVLMTPTKK
jgi:hypothetical protein